MLLLLMSAKFLSYKTRRSSKQALMIKYPFFSRDLKFTLWSTLRPSM